MNRVDRWLQRWRIRVAGPYVPKGARVLDVGCADGVLARLIPGISHYVGIDPDATERQTENVTIIRGVFPDDLPESPPFDVITMLAVLEHVPEAEQAVVANACARALKPNGRLLITTPAPIVDHLLGVLRFFRIVDGMAVEQHHGFEPCQTPSIFAEPGFVLIRWRRFQLGLNSLFVFRRP